MDLQSVCEGVRAILHSAALERGVSIRIDYQDRLPKYIKGDPVRIRQVLLNLAGNAVKFTQSGSVHIAVTQLDAARLKVSVTDTGIGISSEQLATLFQRYTQADSSTARRYGGTGLGLAISKTLVELMGGEIGALSTPGAGSTFWFVLPLRAGARDRHELAPALPAAPAPSSRDRKVRGCSWSRIISSTNASPSTCWRNSGTRSMSPSTGAKRSTDSVGPATGSC